jgi:hypothetical protein
MKRLSLHDPLMKYLTGHILKEMCEGFVILKIEFSNEQISS